MKNRYLETVIGYDCREMGSPKSVQTNSELLRFNVERRFTIGRFSWNSIFLHNSTYIDGYSVGTAPGYTLSIPFENRTSDHFWEDEDDMMAFVHQHADSYQQPFWAMAFSVVQTPKYERYLAKWLETYKSEIVPFPLDVDPHEHPEWTFLGYDVQDAGPSFWEGLNDGAYPDEIEIPLQEKWDKFLNKYRLFDDQTIAADFSDWQEEHENHAYFAYGLYLMKAHPK